MCVGVCVCVCVCACVRACVRAGGRAGVGVCVNSVRGETAECTRYGKNKGKVGGGGRS